MKVGKEVREFVRQHVGVGYDVEIRLSELLLHSQNIQAKAIFSSNFVTRWEVIDLLVLIQPIIQVGLSTCVRPQHIPIVTFCMSKPVALKQGSD